MPGIEGRDFIQVFVHLAYSYGAETWNRKFKSGKLLGINEPFAYGYHRAAGLGCRITYSKDKAESPVEKLFRLAIRFFMSFDLVHAWRNRKGILDADVVWTHTESQNLAILLLFWLLRPRHRPKLIAQVTWIFDRWHKFSGFHRWLFTKLLSRADVLTVHSPENLKVARQVFPGVRSELVRMGIRADTMTPPRARSCGHPIRLISLGNDEHRDWETMIRAVRRLGNCELRIASRKVSPKLFAGAENISLAELGSNSDLMHLYEWADMLILALKPNLHASGITVLQEAALSGVPAICSDTGGLTAYFSGNEVKYVPAGDADALAKAIVEFAADDNTRYDYAVRAQAKMGQGGLSSEAFVARHVELSAALLARAEPDDQDSDAGSGWDLLGPKRGLPRPAWVPVFRKTRAP